MRGWIALALCLPFLAGCVMVEVGVTNPVAGLTTVAIVPFFNLSQERAVDGRRFAFAYYTELQKTPGFQVIPVGVVEQALFDNRLEMNNPDDVLKLADLLGADAVIVGAVTDYSPYYPPRLGLQVSWYSPKPWNFHPGIPLDEFARMTARPHRLSLFKPRCPEEGSCPPPGEVIEVTPSEFAAMAPRGQSPDDAMDNLDDDDNEEAIPLDNWLGRNRVPSRSISLPEFLTFGDTGGSRPVAAQEGTEDVTPRELDMPILPSPDAAGPPISRPAPSETMTLPVSPQPPVREFDPRQPLMSYTRMFDGADARLTARLRDYVELSGDLRSGGWEAYLHRSEDFIRFASHVMIVEMLQLHGGEARKRVVFKVRKNR